jgi:hypothetical protein
MVSTGVNDKNYKIIQETGTILTVVVNVLGGQCVGGVSEGLKFKFFFFKNAEVR